MPPPSYTPTSHHDTYPFVRPNPNSPVSGKNIFITGASKGIGRALALSYARSGVSALVVTARSSLDTLIPEIKDAAKEVGTAAPKIFTYVMDVTDRAAIEKAAEQAEKDLDGRLDILINNAGYLETFTPVAESDPDEYWKTWTVNMRGPYLVTRALLPLMLKGGEKTIVNLSSIGALTIRPGGSAYATTKMAICRFSEFLDAEYRDQGLLVFAVHPGGIVTELANNLPNEMHGLLVDTPELAGDTIVWLAAGRKTWLTGRYVSCNWDMEELERKRDEIVKGDLLKFRLAV